MIDLSCSDSELAQRLQHSYEDARPSALGVKIFDRGEKMYDQSHIEKSGIRCEPFWKSNDQLEGPMYADYLASHPDFCLSVRESVLTRLLAAQDQLPDTWKIILKSAYRPPEVQRAVFDAELNKITLQHPEWSHDEKLKYTRAFVTDPDIVTPPHTTGGAVDIDVYDTRTNALIDFGCPINTDNPKAYLHSGSITRQASINRLILLRAMLRAGFAPHFTEWWHYQYGEAYWAAFYGVENTLYGSIEV